MLSTSAVRYSIATRTISFVSELVLIICLFTACTGIGNIISDNQNISLEKVIWCNKPTIIFTDDQNLKLTSGGGPTLGTPEAIEDWQLFKEQLGFEVYLPAKLPAGSCLLNASGSIHNKIIGSNFTLTYVLADRTTLTIAQAQQDKKDGTFQCSPLSGLLSQDQLVSRLNQSQGRVQLCTGAHGTTNVTFSADWTNEQLQSFFQDLRPSINWIPHS